MLEKFLNNLRGRSEGQRLVAAFIVTLAVAVLMVPLWIWNVRQQTDYIRSKAVAKNTEAAAAALAVSNPVDQVTESLSKTFSEPAKVSDVKNNGDQTVVYFSITNATLTSLTIPVGEIAVTSTDAASTSYRPVKVTTLEGSTFPSSVGAGKTQEGIVYLPRLFNGFYTLRLSSLVYKDDGQSEFQQTVNFQVKDAVLPRT